MQAYVHQKTACKLTQMPEASAQANEVVVKLAFAGLNRRDLYIPNRRDGEADALILGSDGAGIVESVGESVTDFKPGDKVLINPSLGWEKNTPAPPAGFEILGMPDHGTFAEKITIAAEQLERVPVYLSLQEASVVALSGLTAFRALFTKGALAAGETVFIPGAGSGVATFLIQFAKCAGARVIVTSRDAQKREQALALGADMALDTAENWQNALATETIDLVIDSVGEATFNRSLDILKQGGRIVIFGATTADTIKLNLRAFFYGQYTLLGATMGSKEELQEMLSFIEEHTIKPVMDKVFPLHAAADAFAYLQENKQFGKIALAMEHAKS